METDNQVNQDKKVFFSLIGGAMVLLLLLIGLVAYPLTKKIFSSKDRLDESRLVLDDIKADMTHRDTYRELRESIGESKDLLERAVLKEATIVTFIEDLEQTGRSTGNNIIIAPYTPATKSKKKTSDEDSTSIGSDSTSKNENTDSTKSDSKSSQYFLLTISGDYRQLLNFISKLENMGYVFKIDSIEAQSNIGTNNMSLKDLQAIKAAIGEGVIETKIIISFSLQK